MDQQHPFTTKAADVVSEPALMASVVGSAVSQGVGPEPIRVETWEFDEDFTAYRCVVIHWLGRALVCAEPTRSGRGGSLRTWFAFDSENRNALAQSYVAEKLGFGRDEFDHVDARNLTKLVAAALRRVALVVSDRPEDRYEIIENDVPTGRFGYPYIRWIPPTGADEDK